MVELQTTPQSEAQMQPLKVYLAGEADRCRQAAWALDALLTRARVHRWEYVKSDVEGADLVWGDNSVTAPVKLPTCNEAWSFSWSDEPDSELDPLAFTFWWLARVEEHFAPDHAFDQHGRFRYEASQLARRGDPFAAPVDELALTLAEQLASWQRPRQAQEPRFRVIATHDIDLPIRWTRKARRRFLRATIKRLVQGDYNHAWREINLRIRGAFRKDPWDNFSDICSLEEQMNARSTSYLLMERRVPEDGDLELLESGRRWAGNVVDDRVGLHGSYTSSLAKDTLASEVIAMRSLLGLDKPIDHRFHYLRHRPTDSWPILDQLGVRTDSSLGYAEQPGFRAGTASAYRAWDHENGRPLALVVIPLVVMDASYDERYLGLSQRERERHFSRIIERIASLEGCASILLHNDRLCNPNDDGWTRFYQQVLQDIRDLGGKAGSAQDALLHLRNTES